MAPEIFEKEYLTIKTDVWSLGIVLLRLLCERDEPFVEFRSNQKEFQKLKWHEYAPDELASFVPVPDVNCLNFHGPQEIQKQVKSLLAGFFQPEEKRDIDFGKVISSFENIIDKIPSRIEVEVVVDDVEKNLTPFLYQGVIITTWPQAFRHVYGATYENQLSYWQYLGLVPRENQKKWIYYLTGAFFVVFCNSILKAIETFFCFYYMSPSSAKTPHWKVISGLFGLLYYVIKPISSPLASLNGVKKQELCKGFYDSYTGFYYVIIVLYSFLVNIGAFFLFAHGITELSVAIIGNENSKALGRAFFSTYVESYPDETQAGAILLIVAMIAILDFVNAKLMHPDARLCGKPLWKQPLDGGENFKTQRRRLLSDPNASRVGMTLFPDRGMPRSVSYSTSSDTWSASPTPPLLTRSLSSAKSSVSSQVFFDDKPFKGLQASFNS